MWCPLYKNFKEREDKKLPEKTESIWPYILTNSESFINGHYTKSTIDDVIIPSPSIIKMAFWSRLYAKWDPRKDFYYSKAFQYFISIELSCRNISQNS